MKTLKNKVFYLLILSIVGFSCDLNIFEPKSDINDPNATQGNLSLSITDAPIDQNEISGAFVTISEIKIDGKTYTGFTGPKTINILALQNGNTLNLGQGGVAAGSYSTLTLVLDAEKDETGNAPGCFLTKTNGAKEQLEISGNGKTEIDLKPKNFTVTENGNTEIIMDFDLRKSIKSKNNDYSFVSLGELKSAVRAENKAQTGKITGKIENYSAVKSDVIVYVYKKGQFNSTSEINGQGSSDIKFANAITSAKVDANGNFTLAFLPTGNYEIHCEKPDKSASLGLGINTLLDINSAIDLKAVGVNAGTQTNLSLNIKLSGILGI
ncbi:DUF4382 domain-containing protein [Lacihabitans sp. LS3-19]|uniref:DUF4382 domain-containing protein n=1 Tax=Lacihabitans sp. LS3-19 TaxID=2487335 RepID=UPI0020CE2B9E|nr:DUF4382 domain-containing protein [Lacihabitans sp. LS3-19]MCP9766377.1 DUF4382 domain-containing protein [Lacihabitans sp. LS3-19]